MLDELNLLIIGNSFSEDTMQWVYHIAFDAGVSAINLGVLYIGGSQLSQHFYNARNDVAAYEFRRNSDETHGQWVYEYNCKISNTLSRYAWDYVVLQQLSTQSGNEQSFGELPDMISYVKERAPQAHILWNMTWSYDDFYMGDLYDGSSAKMREAIVATVQKVIVPNKDIAMLIPVGTAIQNARTSSLTTLTRDGLHLNMLYGRYIAGLMLVRQVANRPIDDVTYMPDGMTELQLQIAKQAVNAAFAKPFETTNMDL